MEEEIEIVSVRSTRPKAQPLRQYVKSPRRPPNLLPTRRRPSIKEVIDISDDDEIEEIKLPTVSRTSMKRKASPEHGANAKGKLKETCAP